MVATCRFPSALNDDTYSTPRDLFLNNQFASSFGDGNIDTSAGDLWLQNQENILLS